MMSRLVLLAGVVFTSLVTPGESTDNCPCPILEGYQRPPSDDNGDDIWDGAGTWSGGTGIEPICDTLHDKVWNAWTPVASVWELAGPLVYADEEEMVSEIASGFDTAFTGDGPLDNYVLLRWRAKFDVPTAGEYEFKIRSDDGALLYIDEELVVNNDGVHPPRNRDGEITLAAGEHTFAIAFFDRKGGATLQVEWSPTPGARLSDFLNDDLRSVESNCPCQDWMTTTVTTTVTTTDPTTGAVVVEEVEEEVFDAASYNAGLAGNAAGRVAVSNDEGMGAGWVILIILLLLCCCAAAAFFFLAAKRKEDGNITNATSASPCIVTVKDGWNSEEGFQVSIDAVNGSIGDVLNGAKFFCKSCGDGQFELYTDESLKDPVDTSSVQYERGGWKALGGGNAVLYGETPAMSMGNVAVAEITVAVAGESKDELVFNTDTWLSNIELGVADTAKLEKIKVGQLKYMKDNADDMKTVDALFAACDADGNGSIDKEELVQRYGNQAAHMLKEFDLDGGKTISKDEFVAVLDAKYAANPERTAKWVKYLSAAPKGKSTKSMP